MKGKIYRLAYELKKTKIKVKYPLGVTDECETGETLGQGTNEGAIFSAANLDCGIREQFANSTDEVMYEDLRLGPCIFQDDIAIFSFSLVAAQAGNNRIESKLLHFNLDKCCVIVFEKKREKEDLKNLFFFAPYNFLARE